MSAAIGVGYLAVAFLTFIGTVFARYEMGFDPEKMGASFWCAVFWPLAWAGTLGTLVGIRLKARRITPKEGVEA
jgi:hypothetical protein